MMDFLGMDEQRFDEDLDALLEDHQAHECASREPERFDGALPDGRRWNGLAYVHNAPVPGCNCDSCHGWFDRDPEEKPDYVPLPPDKFEGEAA
jgi:hypothetical protein